MHTVALAYRGITIVPNPPRPAYQIMRVGLKPGGPDRPYARERERDSAFTLLQSPIKHWGALVAEGSRTPLMPCRRRGTALCALWQKRGERGVGSAFFTRRLAGTTADGLYKWSIGFDVQFKFLQKASTFAAPRRETATLGNMRPLT